MSDAATVLALARGTLDLGELAGEMRPRAAAILTRQALEQAVGDALRAEGADPRQLAFRTQLEVLGHLRPRDARPADAAFAWAALSRATHYHGYELPPTREALDDWMALAARAIEALARPRDGGAAG